MKNLSKIEEENRFYNWYNGYTLIQLPYEPFIYKNSQNYELSTSASTGSLKTQYFGDTKILILTRSLKTYTIQFT